MMIPPQRYFPWKVARQFFFGHLIFVIVTLVLTGFSLRYFAYTNFLQTSDIHRALARFDSYLTSLFSMVLAGAALYLAVSTRFYVRPLGRLIQRARELRRIDARIEEDVMDPDAQDEEPGEWYDLERALNRIHKDLRAKTEALSREREELSALIGAVSDAILAVTQDGTPLFFNSQFALLFRVAKKGQKALTLTEMFRTQEILQGYREVLASGQPRTVAATVHTAHHPLPRHFSISIAPLRSGEGEPVYGALGIFHDVTELKQSEQIRIEFVGNASHELRTPITSIKGYVETLRADIKDQRYESARAFLDVIAKNVDRLIFLVNDLLDLSTLESGAQLQRSVVSTHEVTESVLKQLENKRAAKRQEIEVHYGTDALRADPRRLEQVLVNLVHNAIKYIPEGKRIKVAWEAAPEGAVLRVKDNGPGVPLEHQSRLFERFYRIDPGRSRDQGGTGLGLSIVKHIMIKHGGNIRLVSQPGQGSEFICTFPD
jgi:two-component system, OmpR family, phosphate regulon sensor histidine kinase PhoR